MDSSLAVQTTAVSTSLNNQSIALINRCLNGEEAAYIALYNMYAGMIYRLTMSLLQHQQDAEEVMQDCFEYAFRSLDKYDPKKASFKTWLYQIAISRARNKRRRKWLPTFSIHQMDHDIVTDTQTTSPDEQVQLSNRQKRVLKAIQSLSPKLRETAVLRTYAGLTFSEIGEVLNIPAKTAESRMRLAHKALKEQLAGEL